MREYVRWEEKRNRAVMIARTTRGHGSINKRVDRAGRGKETAETSELSMLLYFNVTEFFWHNGKRCSLFKSSDGYTNRRCRTGLCKGRTAIHDCDY